MYICPFSDIFYGMIHSNRRRVWHCVTVTRKRSFRTRSKWSRQQCLLVEEKYIRPEALIGSLNNPERNRCGNARWKEKKNIELDQSRDVRVQYYPVTVQRCGQIQRDTNVRHAFSLTIFQKLKVNYTPIFLNQNLRAPPKFLFFLVNCNVNLVQILRVIINYSYHLLRILPMIFYKKYFL